MRSVAPPSHRYGRLAPLVAGALMLGGWQLGVQLSGVPASFLPSPWAVLSTLVEQRGLLWENSLTTLLETVLGVGLAVASALVWALLLDRSRLLRRALTPYLVASQTVPIIVLAPLMLLWFGFGLLPKVLLVALFAFFPIVLSTLSGLDETPAEHHDLMRSFAASPWQTFRLRWPSALPSFFAGLRITLTYSVTGAIFAEYVGGFSGLGILLQTAANSRATPLVFAIIVVIALLSSLLVSGVRVLERLVMPWRFP